MTQTPKPLLPTARQAIATEGEAQVLALHDEEVVVSRRAVAGDTVRVSKVVRSEDRLVQETLTHRRVEVTRVPVGRYVDAVPPVRQDGEVTILPVVEEVVVTERRLLLKEEVHVRRIELLEDHAETVTVRREEAVIERIPAPAGNPQA